MIAHLPSPWVKYKVRYVDHHRHEELGIMVHRDIIINAHGPIHAEEIMANYVILGVEKYDNDVE